MRPFFLFFRLTLALAAAGALSYTPFRPPPSEAKTYGDPGPPPAEAWFEALAAESERASSYTGAAVAKIYGGDGGTFHLAFGRVPPDRSRLEVSALLFGTGIIATAAGEDTLVYFPRDDVAVLGTGAARAISELLGAEFPGGLHEILDGFLGRVPLYAAEIDAGELELDSETVDPGKVLLTWRRRGSDSPLQQILVENHGGREAPTISNVRLFAAGEVVIDVTYDEWSAAQPPTPAVITLKTRDRVAEIKIKKVKFDVEIEEGAFATTPPPGATVWEEWPEAWDQGGGD